jgi:hypothetical protein
LLIQVPGHRQQLYQIQIFPTASGVAALWQHFAGAPELFAALLYACQALMERFFALQQVCSKRYSHHICLPIWEKWIRIADRRK